MNYTEEAIKSTVKALITSNYSHTQKRVVQENVEDILRHMKFSNEEYKFALHCLDEEMCGFKKY